MRDGLENEGQPSVGRLQVRNELKQIDFAEYVSRISFRFFQPHMRLADLPKDSKWLRRLNVSWESIAQNKLPDARKAQLEIINTKLPVDRSKMAERLAELCVIPRMSTFAIGAIINQAVSLMPDDCCFLNIGVWHGFTLLAGMMQNSDKRCIGVDNFSEYGGPREEFLRRFNQYRSPNHHFYETDYINYLSKFHKGRIGVYIYDGEHSYNNQLKGLLLAEPYFSENCIVLVDDTNWIQPKQATSYFINNGRHRYRTLLDETTAGNSHPSWWNGIVIFQRVS
jgi:hypothetical protein